MRTIFITGANRGLGLEFTKQYSANNYKVFGCCRDLENATELMHLMKRFPYMKIFQGNISNQLELEAIAEELEQQPIDIIINNAGVFGNHQNTLEEILMVELIETFKINAVALINFYIIILLYLLYFSVLNIHFIYSDLLLATLSSTKRIAY